MENQKNEDKASLRRPDLGSRVGYVWRRYQHPYNTRPKTVPLIK